MSEKSIIIIGAGLAGLSTGYYCQLNGYKTKIFEHHITPGGVATCWRRNDYLIDGGIHFLMGYKPGQSTHQLYQELGVFQMMRIREMNVYAQFRSQALELSVDLTSDIDKFGKELKQISPADTQLIDNLITKAHSLQGLDMFGLNMAKPVEIMGLADKFKQLLALPKFIKYFGGKSAVSMAGYAKNIQHPFVKHVIENIFMPDVPVWFVAMLLALLADKQMGLLEGGSLELAQGIEERFTKLGGQVIYSSTVEKINVFNHQTDRITLADGQKYDAHIIISAADGYSTIFNMLDGKYVNSAIKRMYEKWPLFNSLFMLNFGVAREFTGEPYLTLIKLKRPFDMANIQVNSFSIRIFNYSPKFSPAGKTVVQVMIETDWDYWNQLHNIIELYEAEKKRIASEVLQRLEELYPGISSRIEFTDIATPNAITRYTRNYKGAFEGFIPTSEAIRTRVPKTLPKLENFYMAGQWVMPGGGVPSVLYSGRQIAQILCHKDKKKFKGKL